MSKILNLLRDRRSIRKYESKKIENHIIDNLKESVLRSPSSKSNNPWEFIFVDNKDLLFKLSESKPHGSSFLKNAALAVVVLANETKSDVWVEDCSIASIILQITAQSLGIGSCWVQIRNRMHNENVSAENYIKNLLEIPESLKIESIIGLGYPAESKPAHKESSLLFEKISLNYYKKS